MSVPLLKSQIPMPTLSRLDLFDRLNQDGVRGAEFRKVLKMGKGAIIVTCGEIDPSKLEMSGPMPRRQVERLLQRALAVGVVSQR